MQMHTTSATLLLFLTIIFEVHGCTTKWTDPNTGRKYDFSKISGKEVTVNWSTYTAKLSLCGLSSPCDNLNACAACQTWSTSGIACLGVAPGTPGPLQQNNGVGFEFVGGSPRQDGGGPRKMAIYLECGRNENITFLAEDPKGHYEFKWITPSACPGNGGGLTGGAIFMILVLCIAATYFVGGILVMKFYKKAEGKEMIPNLEFWVSLPGLVKDGVVFAFHKITGKGSYQQI